MTLEVRLKLEEIHQALTAFRKEFIRQAKKNVITRQTHVDLDNIYQNFCEIDDCSSKDAFAKEINQVTILIKKQLAINDKNKKIKSALNFKLILKNIDNAIELIETKIEEANSDCDNDEIGIISSTTGKLRQWLSPEMEGFADADEAEDKFWERALRVEKKFYDIDRNKEQDTKKMSKKFLESRKKQKKIPIIDTNKKTGRSLITAETGAVEKSIRGIAPKKIQTRDDIARYTKWNKKRGVNWNIETLSRGYVVTAKREDEIVIKSQYQPAAGNLGNFIMRGTGKYGEHEKTSRTHGILYVINELTDEKPKKEQKLATLFIQFTRKGIGFTEESLKKAGFELYRYAHDRKRQITELNRIGMLFCIKEVSRRKNQGGKIDKNNKIRLTPEFPFGIARAMLLMLLQDGYLRMYQVFDENAEFGVFTGTEIMSERKLKQTKKKFLDILSLFNFCYHVDLQNDFLAHNSGGEILPTAEYFHQILLQIDGGKDESSGDEYSTEDDETPTPDNYSRYFLDLFDKNHDTDEIDDLFLTDNSDAEYNSSSEEKSSIDFSFFGKSSRKKNHIKNEDTKDETSEEETSDEEKNSSTASEVKKCI
ncbi:MAG: hypothetical protein HKM04_04805 [Legionellales bacterium]|nr:hypothetical protein [Legionellales bacterium]